MEPKERLQARRKFHSQIRKQCLPRTLAKRTTKNKEGDRKVQKKEEGPKAGGGFSRPPPGRIAEGGGDNTEVAGPGGRSWNWAMDEMEAEFVAYNADVPGEFYHSLPVNMERQTWMELWGRDIYDDQSGYLVVSHSQQLHR